MYTSKQWKERNKKRYRNPSYRGVILLYGRKWYKEHREECLKYSKKYQKKHKKVLKEKRKEYYRLHPDKLQKVREQHREYQKLIRLEVLSYYSKGTLCCACCKEKQIKFLTIDHILGGGRKEFERKGYGNAFYLYLRREKYPKGFQVLCYNCNCSKGFYGTCPHSQSML